MIAMDRRAALVGLSGALLGACATPSPAPRYSEITFLHLEPIRLDAASLEIVEAYAPPFAAPNVEHLMPTPPAAAARRWAADRLAPAGRAGRIVCTIIDAAVTETALARAGGLRGVVTVDQSERYDARLEVKVAVRGADDRLRGEVTAEATRGRTVAEDLSLNERERIWFEMTEALVRDLDRALDAAIRQFLQPVLL